MRGSRTILGHSVGLPCAIAVVAQGPWLMDRVTCALSTTGLIAGAGLCEAGSARLGEGGVSLSWASLLAMASLVVIMETTWWLCRWYRAPSWSAPIVVAAGVVALQASILGLFDAPADFVFAGALLLGLPVALAFTGYWVPLILFRPMQLTQRPGGAV